MCSLCAKTHDMDKVSKCSSCPFIFHHECMQQFNISKPGGMFICNHHKCSSCNRSTSAAGGLLFRCVGCMTAYCEDCLPQDEIDSVGRCRRLEDLGYNAKQAYYIKCMYFLLYIYIF